VAHGEFVRLTPQRAAEGLPVSRTLLVVQKALTLFFVALLVPGSLLRHLIGDWSRVV
jgi:hypothetical protein